MALKIVYTLWFSACDILCKLLPPDPSCCSSGAAVLFLSALGRVQVVGGARSAASLPEPYRELAFYEVFQVGIEMV